MLKQLWDIIVRWRTALFNGLGAFLVAVAPILGAPEIVAIIPPKYIPYAMAAVFLINWWMRPRAAARQSDPETVVKNTLKGTENATIVVTESGKTMARVEQAK